MASEPPNVAVEGSQVNLLAAFVASVFRACQIAAVVAGTRNSSCPQTLYIFAKQPVAGRVKTRLVPPLGKEQAARCYRAFLEDSVRRMATLAGVGLCIASDSAPWAELRELAGQVGAGLETQGPGDLGERMQRVLARAPAASVVIMGSDSPDLPLSYVRGAFDALADHDVVVGPAEDGGYYLIGARVVVPPVFSLKAAWGSSGVLAETLEKLENARLSFSLLAPWADVDDYQGLRALAERINRMKEQEAGGVSMPGATIGVLDSLRREGLEL